MKCINPLIVFIGIPSSSSKKDDKFPMVIVLAAAGGFLFFVLIVAIICLIVYCKRCCCKSVKQKNMLAINRINSIYSRGTSSLMPQNVYYDKITYNNENVEKVLNIYDLLESNRPSNMISSSADDNFYENIYQESIDPNQLMAASEVTHSDEEEDKANTLLPYMSIYNNPTPLNKTEAPTIVSWDNIIPCTALPKKLKGFFI